MIVDLQEFLSLDNAKYPTVTLCLEVVSTLLSLYWIDFIQEPYKEDDFLTFNVTKNQYSNPKLYKYKNLSHLYTIPYDDVSLSFNDGNFKLETLISLRNKTHLFKKFKFRGKYFRISYFVSLKCLSAEPSLRDKYHKCFSCDLTNIKTKIFKIRVKLEVKVLRVVSLIKK